MGWAEFCSIDGILVAGLGTICFAISESREIEMRQLDLDRKREESNA